MVDVPTFSTSLERSSWVQSQLKNRGSSFSAVALKLGLHRSTVTDAMNSANDTAERAIAEAIGVKQEELFPERYDSEGRRLHAVKNKRLNSARNVKTTRAA